MVRVLVTTDHRGLAGSSVQLRLYSKQLWTLVSVQTQGPSLLGTSWLRTHDKGRATNLPCNNLLWGKSFKGTAAGQKKPLHLDWQWGKLLFVHQEMEFLVAMERTRAASVYLGNKPSHCILTCARPCTAPGSTRERTSAWRGTGEEAPSPRVNPSSLAGRQQVQDED